MPRTLKTPSRNGQHVSNGSAEAPPPAQANGKQASSAAADAPADASANGQDRLGRFSLGNPGGPGNPFARQSARMLDVFRQAI